MTHKGKIAVGLLFAAAVSHAAEPTSRPAVPALVAGEGSFVVEGAVRPDEGAAGVGFSIVADGAAERVALFGLADGVPLFLSDGRRTLVYDVTGNRVVLLSPSRGLVGVEWDASQAKPMTFALNVRVHDDPAKLASSPAAVRLDRFPASAEARDGGDRFERRSGQRINVLTRTADGFRFTDGDAANPSALQLVASDVGRPIDRARLAFPDVARLRADGVTVTEVTGGKMATLFMASSATGGGMGAKMGLLMGGELREKAVDLAGGEEALLKRDAALGAAYRAALAKQGIAFGPTTRPGDE